MNWDAISAISEAVGALGVILTIAYLAVQIRQNTRTMDQHTAAVTSASEIAGADEAMEVYMQVANNHELADILYRGNRRLDALSPQELIRFSAYWQSCFISHQNAFFHNKQGFTSNQLWHTYSRNISQYMLLPGVYAWWQRVLYIFDEEFVAYMKKKPSPTNSGTEQISRDDAN
jgi:hypothetical protein